MGAPWLPAFLSPCLCALPCPHPHVPSLCAHASVHPTMGPAHGHCITALSKQRPCQTPVLSRRHKLG